MKKLFLVLPIFFFACSGPKDMEAAKKEVTYEEIKDNKENLEDQYTCNIEIINNLMPSPEPRKYMYAIVTLLPHEGKLEQNWKLSSFQIDGQDYSFFDETTFSSKELLIYRNTVREIPKGIKAPLSAKVQFENEQGTKLTYHMEILKVFDVH